MTSFGNTLYVKFVSDTSTSGTGFRASYTTATAGKQYFYFLSSRATGLPVCSILKFISEASHLNLLFFCVLNVFLLGIQPSFTVRNYDFLVVSHLKCRATLTNFKITKQLKVVVK